MQKSHNEVLLDTQLAILDELRAIRSAMYVQQAASQAVIGSTQVYNAKTGSLTVSGTVSGQPAMPQQCVPATPEAAQQ